MPDENQSDVTHGHPFPLGLVLDLGRWLAPCRLTDLADQLQLDQLEEDPAGIEIAQL